MMNFSTGESVPKKKKIFSELIKWFEGTNHSHVFVSWKDEQGLRWVAEAKGSGVRMLSNVQFKKETTIKNIYSYECEVEGFNLMIQFIWAQLAKAYGFKQIYGLAEMRVLNKIYRVLKLNKRTKNRFTDGDASLICCELLLRSVEFAKQKKMTDDNIEYWGLRETQAFDNTYGTKQSKVKIDKINGVV